MDNIDKTCVCDVNRIKHFKKPMYNHLIKPRVLPPLKTKYNDFKTVCSPCKYTRPGKICNYSFNTYTTRSNSRNKSQYSFNTYTTRSNSRNKSQYSLANYPHLNPLFNFEKIFEEAYNHNSDDYNSDNISDELDYQYEQRKWIKSASDNIVKKNKISLMRGDVVNIDKKTLIYVNYNEKAKLHIFKELTSLKVHEYDLNKRNYTVVIPKILKHDITLKNLKKEVTYKDPFEKLLPELKNTPITEDQDELAEGYLSDLENGASQQNSIKTSSDNYVSNTQIESVYNIDKTVTKPKIVIHQDEISKIAGDLVDDIIKNVVSDIPKESVAEETKKDNSIEIKKDVNKEIEKEIEKDNSTDPKKLDADKNITDDSKWCTIM